MTKKLIRHILTTCLLFSSLYLPVADAGTAKRPAANGSEGKKSPETNFLKGDACLKKSDFSCVKLMQAGISSQSPYAKLLEGALALKQNQIDRAFSLLLPMQSTQSIIPQAKLLLHQSLALAFETTADTAQALQHWVMAKTTATQMGEANLPEISDNFDNAIWALLANQSAPELVSLRGSSSDTVFQGWIDLRLASLEQDKASAIKQWISLYQDHPARKFSETLLSDPHLNMMHAAALPTAGNIALIIPTGLNASSPEMHAFHLGMQTALNHMQLSNLITIVNPDNEENGALDNAQDSQQAKHDYFIAPQLDAHTINSQFANDMNQETLRINLSADDEAADIVNFADQHAMQRITVISTKNEASQRLYRAIQSAWEKQHPGQENQPDLSSVMLQEVLAKNSPELLELNANIMAKSTELVVLALPADEVSLVKPYLNISMPTITFSGIDLGTQDANTPSTLYGLRFLEIPWLLKPDTFHAEYKLESANLTNPTQLRWFALGVDSILLTIEKRKSGTKPFSLNGLAGNYEVNPSGEIRRHMLSARLTPSGIEAD